MTQPSQTASHPHPEHGLLACPECDLLFHCGTPARNSRALCTRCGATLYRHRPYGIEVALAMSLAGLLLFAVANLTPLLELNKGGLAQEMTLWSGIASFIDQGEWLLSGLGFATLILFPLLRLGALLYVLGPISRGWRPHHAARIYRLCHLSSPWSMLEIFLLGGLVAVVKLGKMATIMPGIAAYAFVGVILVSAWADYNLEPRDVWARIGGHHGG